ncbi:hypothetical protein DDR33_15760 [Pararcticibacter amylolyticus]|uniref:DUF5977 domain-containing protein n=1 Tax=Pararcticibacter amylolyticus TaxID=2173175 RepID=A0A2U2PDQ6_9SPHI|nr:hypothetical protein DDR33_15760 [Pararcticibacter amylolyticus]
MILPFFGRSQEPLPMSLPQVMPPSPQAQMYMRYGEIPVDLSTGVPGISIPIYTLKAGKFELPINISYHASGNKVSDVASPVGLGWVLNAGGVIIQNIVSERDSYPVNFTPSQEIVNALGSQPGPDSRFLQYAENARYTNLGDVSSDRYVFNFNGMSGTFRYNIQTKQIETFPYTPLKIEKLEYGKISITDTDGVVWIFLEKGIQTGMNSASGGSVEYHLTEILLPGTNNKIEFTYINSNEYSTYSYSENARYGMNERYERWWRQFPPTDIPMDPSPWYLISETTFINARFLSPSPIRTDFKSPLLKNIKWKDQIISFEYMSDRLDPMKERLVQIKVAAANDEKNIFFKNAEYLGTDAKNYRMLLTGLEIGSEKYKFSYNPTALPKYPNHDEANFSDDFWGYYNGVHSSHIPFLWTNGSVNPYVLPVRSYTPSREPNINYGRAGIIESITYPTGGKTVFEFEQNRGKNVYLGISEKVDSVNFFGGLRVKTITNYLGNTLVGSRYYEYENGSTTTSITPDHFIKKKQVFNVPTIYDPEALYNKDDLRIYQNELGASAMNGYPISDYGGVGFYRKVIEYNGSKTANSGKTEFIFSAVSPRAAGSISQVDIGNIKPRLETKSEYVFRNNLFHLVRRVENNYQKIEIPRFVTGLIVTEGDLTTDPYPIFSEVLPASSYLNALRIMGYEFNSNFEFGQILADKSFYVLKQTHTENFLDNGNVNEYLSFTYDPSYRVLSPIETKFTDSDGALITEVSKYPFNFPSNPVCNQMVLRNMLSPVVEKIKSKNNQPVDKILTEYRLDNFSIVKGKIYYATGSNSYQPRIEFKRYDEDGNLLHVTKDSVLNISYLWSYKGEFPVAEVKNATYSQIENILGAGAISSFRALMPDKPAIDNFVNPLRAALPNSQIVSYSYSPLKGIRSITDAKKMSSVFEYDNLNRLLNIKNHGGNILKNYSYNYMPQEPVIYYNVLKTGTFTRNNCPAGKVGGQISYSIAAGTYSSTQSQEAADQKAIEALQTQGQAAANLNAKCTIPNPNPNNLFFVIENNAVQSMTGFLRINGVNVGALSIPSGQYQTFSFPPSSPSSTFSLQLNSGVIPDQSEISSIYGVFPGAVVPVNTILFDDVDFSSPETFTISLY